MVSIYLATSGSTVRWKQFQLYFYIYILACQPHYGCSHYWNFFNLCLLILMFMMNYRHPNSNHTKPVQKAQRCRHCTSSRRKKGASNCITKETPSKSWLTAWTAANDCHCFWSIVRCPQVCLGLVCRLLFDVFLQLWRCHESRLLSETKCVPLTEEEEQTHMGVCVWLKMRLRLSGRRKFCVHYIRAILAQVDSVRHTPETIKTRFLLISNYKMLADQRSSSAELLTGLSVRQSITEEAKSDGSAWFNTDLANKLRGWNQMVFVQHHTDSHYC